MASNGNHENPGGSPVPKANGAAPQDGDVDNADAISDPAKLADPPPVVGEVPIPGPQLQVNPPPAKPQATAKQAQAPAVIAPADHCNHRHSLYKHNNSSKHSISNKCSK